MASQQPDWAPCGHPGCIGIQLPTFTLCLAHADEHASRAFHAELKRIRAEGTVDARGVVISAQLLVRLLAAAPRDDNRPTFTAARFDRASFEGQASFDGASFRGDTRFSQARFKGGAGFSGARFEDRAWFNGASFEGDAWFEQANFQREAVFHLASFQDDAWFDKASFEDEAMFGQATFQGKAGFEEASFQGDAWFVRAGFQGEAKFRQASFQGEAKFDWAGFQDAAVFAGTSFERATQLGPLLARRLVLDGAVFSARVQLDATAAAVSARRTQFPGGVYLRLRYATVDLDDADLAAPTILAGVPSPYPELEEQMQPDARAWALLPPGPPTQRWRPRLLSVERADVAGLRLADVDLRACRFVGAHNLDKLRIEATPQLALPPPGWHFRRVGGEGLPIWRWASRMTLAEEQHWRANRPLRRTPAGQPHPQLRGWYPPACRAESELGELPRRSPVQLAALYRELRKGLEDAKNEPGAADFYYGEMEMRRHNTDTPLGERFVLWLYWLTSGYSLRGLRALICLAVVVLTLAGLLHAVGFRPLHPVTPRSFWSSVLYAAESTLSLGGADVSLTGWGRALRIVLRLTGPVLLGLALLSVRNRVKR